MKNIKKLALILVLLIFASSCDYIGIQTSLPDSYKAVKEEYKLSKIMSKIDRNANKTEIIEAELEIRIDRFIEILLMSKIDRENLLTEINVLDAEISALNNSPYSAPYLHATDRKSVV